MNFSYPQIVLTEVPGEIALAISISGCPLRCKGCHSKETYNSNYGEVLTFDKIDSLLQKHISCVLFYGGEWESKELIKYLIYIKSKNIKTCLYTGHTLEQIDNEIIDNLNYIKVGEYIENLGGLRAKTTNQKFFKIKNKKFKEIKFN